MDCKASTDVDERFERAWRACLPMLLRRARRLAGGHADRADELLAATALKALLCLRRRPQCLDHVKGFLLVVLRHVFVDGIRRSIREGQVFDGAADIHETAGRRDDAMAPSAMQWLEHVQQIDGVQRALRRLSPEQRQLFAFRFIDDLPYPQIAERLGVNQPLLRKRVQLIRDRLRSEIRRIDAPRSESGDAAFTAGAARRYHKGSDQRRELSLPSTQGTDHG